MRLLILALAVLPLPLWAETYTVPSAPSAVTVYAGFATVTRKARFTAQVGTHELILPDLPLWVDPASLRVTLEGARLDSSRLRTGALPPQPDRDSAAVLAAKARIEQARRALRDLDDAVEDATLAAKASEARAAFLSGLSSSRTLPSEPEALAALAQMIEVQSLAATQAQVRATREATRIADGRKALEDDLADAQAALEALTPPAEPRALLALSLTADQPGTVVATLQYPARAAWQPTYDIALTRGPAPRMALRRAAIVYQNTGENWENVTLTLSTLAPSGQVIPSELFPPLLRIEDPARVTLQQRASGSLDAESSVAAAPVAMEETARPGFDGPGVTYTLPGRISVAQGAEGARIALDTLEFDARVFARAVPERDTTAFLMAEAVNDTQEPLLAADTVQIMVDGALVGRGYFAQVPAGGDIVQAFGPIEDLRLTHTVLDRSTGDRGLINRSNARKEAVRLEVENLGARDWTVELRGTVPYSEQEDLTIDWSAQPRADVVNVDDRRGLLQWDLTLAPGARQEVMIEQDIRWPEGKVLR